MSIDRFVGWSIKNAVLFWHLRIFPLLLLPKCLTSHFYHSPCLPTRHLGCHVFLLWDISSAPYPKSSIGMTIWHQGYILRISVWQWLAKDRGPQAWVKHKAGKSFHSSKFVAKYDLMPLNLNNNQKSEWRPILLCIRTSCGVLIKITSHQTT